MVQLTDSWPHAEPSLDKTLNPKPWVPLGDLPVQETFPKGIIKVSITIVKLLNVLAISKDSVVQIIKVVIDSEGHLPHDDSNLHK